MTEVVLVGGILILAVALRWHGLGRESLWFDEAYSIELAARSVRQILSERWIDIHPPLYYLSLHTWMSIAGGSEVAARLLSVVFDAGAVLAAFALTRQLVGREAAVLTTLLLSVSRFHIEYSQESRMYALLALTSTLSMAGFVAVLRRPTRLAQAGYAVATSLMLYTHVYGTFVLGAQMVVMAIVWHAYPVLSARRMRAWLAGGAGALVLFSPWAVTLADQVTRVQSAFWIERPGWDAIVSPFRAYAGSTPLLIAALPLAVVGAWWTWTRARVADLPSAVILLPWLVLPTVVPLVISQISSPIFMPKYTIAASIPFAMLVACGIVALPGRVWRAAALIAVVAPLVPVLQTYYTDTRKDDWRNAVVRLEAQAQSGDVVVFYPWYNQVPFDYYHRRADLVREPFIPDIQTVIPQSRDVPALVTRVRDRPRLWFVVLQGTPEREHIVQELSRAMSLRSHTVSRHVELFLFTPGPASLSEQR